MKILERAVMPNGTKIQLEDWSEYNTAEHPDTYGFAIEHTLLQRIQAKTDLYKAEENLDSLFQLIAI